MQKKLNWSESIFFFDVDDTLIDTAENSIPASEGIYSGLKTKVEENKAREIQKDFNKIFKTLMIGHTVKSENDWNLITGGKIYHDELLNKINKLQSSILSIFGNIKKWSREVFLKMAADDCGVILDSKIITELIDSYWLKLSEISMPMKGVLSLFNDIGLHNRPIYLITSSDARLQLNKDQQFTYHPKDSERFKVKRMEELKSKGIKFNKVSIGDPEDKPHKDFFEKGIKIAETDLHSRINPMNIVMFGDSYAGDLQTPREQFGFGLVVLYRKGQGRLIEEGDRYISTGNISNAVDYFV